MDEVRKWRAPLPRVLTAKPFSVAEAIIAGISPKQLRRDGLDRPFRGIRSMGHDLTRLEVLCLAYSVHMLSTHVFSHATAARLMGLPLPLPLEQAPELHVSAAAPGRAPQVNGVVGHQFSGGAVVTHRGLRITGPEFTWVSLAPMLTLRDLVAVGDALVEGDYPWTTIDKLRAAINPGIRGTVKLRKAVQLIRLGVRSRPENHLRLAILGAGLPEPTVAHPVWVPLLQRHLHLTSLGRSGRSGWNTKGRIIGRIAGSFAMTLPALRPWSTSTGRCRGSLATTSTRPLRKLSTASGCV